MMKITLLSISTVLIALNGLQCISAEVLPNPCKDKRGEEDVEINLPSNIMKQVIKPDLDQDSVSAIFLLLDVRIR